MISWGRKATVVFNGANVTNIQDVSVGDEANDLTAEARDLAYVIHGVGAKDFSVEFDALMSERPYKRAWPCEKAFAFLEKGANTHFDGTCVEVCFKHQDEILAIRACFQENYANDDV